MLCPSCNAYRPANNAPCPQCHAPSPLVGQVGGQYQVTPASPSSWGGPITPASGNGWGNQISQGSFQAGMNDNALWGQIMAPQTVSGPLQQQQSSTLPMPYQGGTELQQQMLKVTSSRLPTIQTGNGSMMPAIPGVEVPIHVPPMYTKPRAIIPPYRAISGLISVIIVAALLCTGAGFYARATGKLAFLHQIYGDAKPDNIKSSQSATLPVPQTGTTFGPASLIINSATTASKIDPATAQPQVPAIQFKAGDTIYLTYSVHPKSPGIVTAKWYTNDNYYQQLNSTTIKEASSGYFPMQYLQPAQGKVELYWNNQLAVTLYFVVEPGQT
jgi:hypothetical protein